MILETPEMSYDYKMFHTAGGTDTIAGRLSVTKDFIHDENAQQLIIKTRRWLYQVDHNNRSIIVADLSLLTKTPETGSVIMQKDHALSIADSLILKYGDISAVNTDKTLQVHVTFPEQTLLRNFDVDYDKKKNKLLSIRVVSDKLYHVDEETYEEEYIEQVLLGSNFSKSVSKKLGRIEDYFTSQNGKIVLKKYKNYKLITINK